MGAFVSIAYVAPGTLEHHLFDGVVERLGFVPAGPPDLQDGSAVVRGRLTLGGEELEAWWRVYARPAWVEASVDVAEDAYDAVCASLGRDVVARELYALAERLMEVPGPDPVVVGLEVEASGPVGAPNEGPLVLQRAPGDGERRPWGWRIERSSDPAG